MVEADARSDTQLIEACLGGEERAWSVLIGRYQRLVYSVPMRLGFKAEDADEVFQETFATLLKRLGTVRDRERIGLWLAVTARRKALDLVRGRGSRREVTGVEPVAVADAGALADEQLVALEGRARVRQALGGLGERCRELLTGLYYEDPPLKYAELARRLKMRPGSLGPTRQRCLEKLRQALDADEQAKLP